MNSLENFSDLLNKSFENESSASFEGKVVRGRVAAISGDMAIVDVGLKSEGKILLKDFVQHGFGAVNLGDSFDVFVEKIEGRNGEMVLSLEKAKKEAVWTSLNEAMDSGKFISGIICGKVKGGFLVDVSGVSAFLPGSQVDVRLIRDMTPLMNTSQQFKVIKMDKSRNNIVLSRKAVIEDSVSGTRAELLRTLEEGQILEGVVKNISDYGAFVDLGGIDGLLHATDICWKRINHPSEILKIGDQLKVQVIKFIRESNRISLGMKQLQDNPWNNVSERYKAGDEISGKVMNVADYGAFVEVEPGIEGLVYVSEITWTRKTVPAHKLVKVGDEVRVRILDVDPLKRRISLSMKRCNSNPWEKFLADNQIGSIIEGTVAMSTEFGLFVELNDTLEGMVHLNDLVWEGSPDQEIKKYKQGQKIKVKLLDVNTEKERIAISLKHLTQDPNEKLYSKYKRGDILTCTITSVNAAGLEVTFGDDFKSFIKRMDLSSDRLRQRTDMFAVGERIDAKVVIMDKHFRKFVLSVKAKEFDDEKKIIAEYGSSDSGASLGDILGIAMKVKE